MVPIPNYYFVVVVVVVVPTILWRYLPTLRRVRRRRRPVNSRRHTHPYDYSPSYPSRRRCHYRPTVVIPY